MMLVYVREIEFHILSDIFPTRSTFCSSWLQAPPHQLPTALSDFHQRLLKCFPFRWLLALVSKVPDEQDLWDKQFLILALSGFEIMINFCVFI